MVPTTLTRPRPDGRPARPGDALGRLASPTWPPGAVARAPRPPTVIAHRGASAAAPENTLAAVREAHAQAAGAVECDVHRTLDGVLVVSHDATLERTTDAARVLPGRSPWRISGLTLAEVRRVDAGRWRGPEHAGERVPTLAEWVAAVGPASGMVVEVKTPGAYPGIELDLEELLRRLPASRSAQQRGLLTVQSFELGWLRSFKELAPGVPVGALVHRRPPPAGLRELAGWADQVNPHGQAVRQRFVRRAHDLGLRVHPWTVDDPARMAELAGWGVDGIITNRPDRLVALLGGVPAS